MASLAPSAPQVHIERVASRKELIVATHRVLSATGFEELARRAERVVIKPNLVTQESASAGITADVALTQALLERLRGLGKDFSQVKIAEGTACAHTTPEVFGRNGYTELAERYDVELVDCNTAPSVKLEVPHHLSVARLRVARVVAEADLRISVAKLKIHSVGRVTGVLKNMMGVLTGSRWKLVVHAKVHKRVVDLNQLVLPHYGLIDGLIGNQMDEVVSNPVTAGIVLGGRDPVALDAVAATCIGVDPATVGYLQHSAAKGFGANDLSNIQVTGAGLEEVKQPFETAKGLKTKLRVNTQKVYGRVLGMMGAR